MFSLQSPALLSFIYSERFWLSIYCLIINMGALPTVDTKYKFVHNVGSLDFNHENSSRSILEDIPLIVHQHHCSTLFYNI